MTVLRRIIDFLKLSKTEFQFWKIRINCENVQITVKINERMNWQRKMGWNHVFDECFDWFESWLLRAKGQHSVARIMMMNFWVWFCDDFFGTWMNSMRIPLISARLTSSCCQCEASCFQTSTISATNCICKSCSELFTAKWVHYLNFRFLAKLLFFTAFAIGVK